MIDGDSFVRHGTILFVNFRCVKRAQFVAGLQPIGLAGQKKREPILKNVKFYYRTLIVPEIRNRFLISFGSERLKQLEPTYTVLRRKDGPIYRVNEPITHLLFIDSGLGSTLAPVPGGRGRKVELWTFGGPFGVIGTHTIFMRPESLYEYQTHTEQTAWKISREAIDREMDADPVFKRQMADLVRMTNMAISQVAVCRTVHSAEQRFCRMLLIIRESLETDRIDLSLATLLRMVPMSRTRWYEPTKGLAQALTDIVTIQGRSLKIHDSNALERQACPCFRETVRSRAMLIGE